MQQEGAKASMASSTLLTNLMMAVIIFELFNSV